MILQSLIDNFIKVNLSDITIMLVEIPISIIISYWFFRVALRDKEPVYYQKSKNLVEESSQKIEQIKTTYKGINLSNLSLSEIIFWNNGRQTIQKSDLDTANHLRVITHKNNKILEAKILYSNNLSNQFTINLSENYDYINFSFDYLDKNQGAVIQIVYQRIYPQDLEVVGDIKGVSRKWNQKNKTKIDKFLERKSIFDFTKRKEGILAGLFLIIMGISTSFLGKFVWDEDILESVPNWMLYLTNIFEAFAGLFIIIYSIVKTKTIPSELLNYSKISS